MPNFFFKRDKLHKKEAGGAAVEYIIVTTFATLLAIAAVGFVTQTLKQKMSHLEEKFGITFDENEFNLF